jgi:putative transposase
MRYTFIQDHREAFPVGLMCRVLEVGRSGFYTWLKRPESLRKKENRRLVVEIRAAHQKSRKTYGSPRIHAELKSQGISCGKHRVSRLMRQHGIVSKHKRKFKATTDSIHSYRVVENKLQRRFNVSEPNRYWVSDITYIPTRQGWLYLAVTLDLFHRKVIGWAMGRWITRKLVIDALNMAIKNSDRKEGMIHHSDRGVQYACNDFQSLLKAYRIECSMSRKGDCWDNAVAESFFHTLKVEQTCDRNYKTRQEAQADIFEYIEVFYNRQRRHSYLGYLTPLEFDKMANVA